MPEVRGEEYSRLELQRQLDDLRREQTRLDYSVQKMEANQKRIFGEEGEEKEKSSPAKPKPTAGQEDEEEKKKDDDSGEEASDGEKVNKAKKNGEDKKDDEEEESKKRKRDDDEEKKKDGRPTKSDQRSRRLFGGLLGHLHAAKDGLKKEKSTKSAQNQQKAMMKVDEKVNQNRSQMQIFRKGHFDTQIKEQTEQMKTIQKEIAEKEQVLLQRDLETHYSLMMGYIRTKAQPTIFFLPAKHTRETEKLLEETRSAIKHKISSLKAQLQQSPEELEAEEAARNSAAAAAMEAAMEGGSKKDNGDDKDDEPEKKKSKTDKDGSDSDES
eukprot:TRINITY_DN21322_c3_g1_i1.p1 TRINITY_DN21322_c3_g1~~TRINITY_DN21322_c3_g1_i1.p1  ORF type:complete len:326 (-),score=134.85 TRINITY_DN21322_c3_g1_i1:131-1108(-)